MVPKWAQACHQVVGQGGGRESQPPASCDTAINISCTASTVFCMSLFDTSQGDFFVVNENFKQSTLHAVVRRVHSICYKLLLNMAN